MKALSRGIRDLKSKVLLALSTPPYGDCDMIRQRTKEVQLNIPRALGLGSIYSFRGVAKYCIYMLLNHINNFNCRANDTDFVRELLRHHLRRTLLVQKSEHLLLMLSLEAGIEPCSLILVQACWFS